MKRKNFYIGNLNTLDPNALSFGVKLIQINTINIFIEFEGLEGPFDSVRSLKRKSEVFKKLAVLDPKRTQKILDPKNIVKANNLIFTETNRIVSFDFIKLLEHAIKGDVKKNNLSGIHYFDKQRMRVIKEIWEEDIHKVWKAEVEVFVRERDVWYRKESTFFPIEWTPSQLFAECCYAYKNMVKSKKERYVYNSKTLTGVPVEIIVKDNEVRSIYPKHIKNNYEEL